MTPTPDPTCGGKYKIDGGFVTIEVSVGNNVYLQQADSLVVLDPQMVDQLIVILCSQKDLSRGKGKQ